MESASLSAACLNKAAFFSEISLKSSQTLSRAAGNSRKDSLSKPAAFMARIS